MNLKKLIQIIAISSIIPFLAHCSDNDKSDGPGPITIDNANLTEETVVGYGADCETSWATYVKQHPVGLLLGYKHTNVRTRLSGETLRSLNSNEDFLTLESNEQTVIEKRTVYQEGLTPYSTNVAVSKGSFLLDCSKVLTTPSTRENAGYQILTSIESLSLDAGVFPVDYYAIQSKSSGESGALKIETWALRDGSRIVAKQINEQTTLIDGELLTTTLTHELTKIVSP